MKINPFYLNDEPAADTGTAPAAETQPSAPETPPAPTEPSTVTAKLSDDDIDRIVTRLQTENKEATEPEPEAEPEPAAPTDDPRDQTMRSLLIKANQVPESLAWLLR